jgi:predicted amidohydrolase
MTAPPSVRRRIGFLQLRPALGEVAANLDAIERLTDGARADLLVVPELATTGYALPDRAAFVAVAEPIPGPTTARLTAVADRIGGHLVVGLAERAGDRLYNAAALIGPRGVVATHRKSHLFWREKSIFDPGDSGFAVHGVGGVRIGIMICFD